MKAERIIYFLLLVAAGVVPPAALFALMQFNTTVAQCAPIAYNI